MTPVNAPQGTLGSERMFAERRRQASSCMRSMLHLYVERDVTKASRNQRPKRRFATVLSFQVGVITLMRLAALPTLTSISSSANCWAPSASKFFAFNIFFEATL
jgi:hypothetical protein